MSMTKEQLRVVIGLCNGVIALAKEAESENPDSRFIYGSKTSGALRRRSMDLTRALAEMRKP